MQTLPVKTCPKCGHVRAANEAAPGWQCPACGIAYNKFRAHAQAAKSVMTPPAAGQAAPAAHADGSIWSLLAVNVGTIAIALYMQWPAVALMAVYWVQSVIIGVFNVLRILSLNRFSTKNFQINGRPVQPTLQTKLQVAFFFGAHYGFFHFVYLIFLGVMSESEPLFTPAFMLCAIGFAINHCFSFVYNRNLDRQGTPNIGTLMFTPYLRIIPMHLTIILGMGMRHSEFALLLFGGLKTAADVAMHMVEHWQWKKVRVANLNVDLE